MQPQQTFKKDERLCSKTLITKLFSAGKSFFDYPFKIVYTIVSNEDKFYGKYPAKVLFTQSRKRFKLAVDRNRIKRLSREGYRKNKHLLYSFLSKHNLKITIAYIYTAKEIVSYDEIERKINTSIERLIQDIKKRNLKT